jgi:hypothetical protein
VAGVAPEGAAGSGSVAGGMRGLTIHGQVLPRRMNRTAAISPGRNCDATSSSRFRGTP